MTPLTEDDACFDALLEQIGERRYVLLGEASHGTHEFYDARARITRRLIEEKGFTIIGAEADWPDASLLNGFVQGEAQSASARDAFSGFARFPSWMWKNNDVLSFIDWLARHNAALPPEERAGFYGLDLYSLYGSVEAVITYLQQIDPAAAKRARERYSCFEEFSENMQQYGYATTAGVSRSCEEEVIKQLLELQQRSVDYMSRDGRVAEDAFFFAEQNARLIKNAEGYYRSMFHGRDESWNLRDRHMFETLEALMEHQARRQPKPKAVVWAHNSHLGDARATDMSRRGELNIGQLVREQHESETIIVGFTTFDGTVTAASDWGSDAEYKHVRPALNGSYEKLLHELSADDFHLNLEESEEVRRILLPRLLNRNIGFIYRPQTERMSHYFHSSLPKQFDAVLHYDRTSAVVPLEPGEVWRKGQKEPPETFPFGV